MATTTTTSLNDINNNYDYVIDDEYGTSKFVPVKKEQVKNQH
jgi:hypothetical protein